MTTTLNGANNTGVTLTNSDLTVTQNSHTAQGCAFATAAVTTAADKKFWRINVDGTEFYAPGYTIIGAVNSSFNNTHYFGQDLNSVGLADDGNIYLNDGPVGSLATYAAGDVIDVELDRANNIIRFRKNGGSWSSDIDISGIAGDMTPAVQGNGGAVGGTATASFTADFFATTGKTAGFSTFDVASSAPTNISPPTITGIAAVGYTLTAHHGAWANAPTSYAQQWERDGTNIAGATASTYLQTSADDGHTITVSEVATNGIGSSAPATSDPTGTVHTFGTIFGQIGLDGDWDSGYYGPDPIATAYPGMRGDMLTPGVSGDNAPLYDITNGHGYVSGTYYGQQHTSSGKADRRLGSSVRMADGRYNYKISINNGTYKCFAAFGSVDVDTFQARGAVDFGNEFSFEVDAGAAIDRDHVLDASGAILTEAEWSASNFGYGGGTPVTVQVTNGYFSITGGDSGPTATRVVWLELVPEDPVDAVLTTDRSGKTGTAAGATTTAGSPVVTGITSTTDLRVGMQLFNAFIPGIKIASVDSPTRVMLESGVGVTAGTADARSGFPVELHEAQTVSRLAPVFFANGTTDGLVVYESDGVTESAYLEIIKVDGTPWLYYKSTLLPATTPYAFKIFQPGGDGHFTDFSLPVILDATKVADTAKRAIWSKYLTQTHLEDRRIRGVLYDNTFFYGYRGQAFHSSAAVKTLSELCDQFTVFEADADGQTNRVYNITLTDGVGSDWSEVIVRTSQSVVFDTSAGNMLLVTNAVGKQVVITGSIYMGGIRGIQFGTIGNYAGVENTEILFAGEDPTDSEAGYCLNFNSSSDARNQYIVENVGLGYLINPAYAVADIDTLIGKSLDGIRSSYPSDQISIRHSRIFGGVFGIVLNACRRFEIIDVKIEGTFQDCINLGTQTNRDGLWGNNVSGLRPGAGGDDCYGIIDGLVFAKDWVGPSAAHSDVMQIDNNIVDRDTATGGVTTAGSAVITSLSDTSSWQEGDVLECPGVPMDYYIASIDSPSQVTLNSGVGVLAGTGLDATARSYSGAMHLIITNSGRVNQTNILGDSGEAMARQWFIPSGMAPVYGVMYNNICCDIEARGMDLGNGRWWVEGNVFAGAAELPAGTDLSNDQKVFAARDDAAKGTVDFHHTRKNVAKLFDQNLGVKWASEDDLIVDFNDGGNPNAVFTGPFTQDAKNRWVFDIDLTLSANEIRKALYNIFKPLDPTNAGLQGGVPLKLLPGQTIETDKINGATTRAITSGQAEATSIAGISARFHETTAEAGSIIGFDVTHNVSG